MMCVVRPGVGVDCGSGTERGGGRGGGLDTAAAAYINTRDQRRSVAFLLFTLSTRWICVQGSHSSSSTTAEARIKTSEVRGQGMQRGESGAE